MVVVDEHGKFRTTHVAGLRRTHDLVYKHGRPYYFRTRSPLYQLEAKVEFEHLYGGGLIVHNAGGAEQTKVLLPRLTRIRSLRLQFYKGVYN